MTKRAVLYSRVSGDDRDRDGRNLAGQLEMCREYAEEKGWREVAALSEDDRGASGASFELPQLGRLLQMARDGAFDVVVVREMDRLSRSLAKQLIVEEELKRHGVEIEYVLGQYPDTPEGSLMKNVRAVIAEYERVKVTERMARGKRLKVRAGNVLVAQHPPYGYRACEVDGRISLLVHEPEAHAVRLIFKWYTEGDDEGNPMSLVKITGKLSEMSIPTYADNDKFGLGNKKRERGMWHRGSVHRILRNETYAGIWHYGKRGLNDDKQQVANPKDNWLAVEVPTIVSRDIWDAAQSQLAQNRQNARRGRRHNYLMGGRLTCGKCGFKMAGASTSNGKGKVYLYYRCPAASRPDEFSRRCEVPSFRADQVDVAVWEWIRSFVSSPDVLGHGLRKYQQEKLIFPRNSGH